MNKYTGKYLIIEYTKYIDGTADSKAIYTFDSENEALATFHSKMGGAMKNVNYAFELLHVINEYGVDIKSEYFERTVNQTNTEENE